MPSRIATGQIDLGSLKEFFLRPDTDSISGSRLNATGFYPYTGNPGDFAHSGYVQDVSGDISGWVETTVSGVLRTDLKKTGLDLSGYSNSLYTELRTDIQEVSGDLRYVSGKHKTTSERTDEQQSDIDEISGFLIETGEKLSVLITGHTGDGLSGYVTGAIWDASGVIDAKITAQDNSLRSHVSEDYLSKRESPAQSPQFVSGTVDFDKRINLKRGLELERVGDRDEVSTFQSGTNLYTYISGEQIHSEHYDVMSTLLRYPQSGDNARQDVIVSTFQYSGGIPS